MVVRIASGCSVARRSRTIFNVLPVYVALPLQKLHEKKQQNINTMAIYMTAYFSVLLI